MPNLTHPALQTAVTPPAALDPPYAAQILTVTAWALELAPTNQLTEAGLDDAFRTAVAGIVGHLPAVVAETATLNARAYLEPLTDITRAEYALRLRSTGRELG
ncbi:hypothetical protein B0675_02175 [Streptomyces sp. M41(2017)]|uniref:hypothetical protein n=1 Tax=Streptomyces sp. M41(2017) TaxID=1955065 RepID=UPI0009C03E85|nr:hypothetical protein [Streptomyces sp. M41(2017)]OQQ16114.1 hypothetical protein B0675_02175 [Streptomyces sp. M41(2017)]